MSPTSPSAWGRSPSPFPSGVRTPSRPGPNRLPSHNRTRVAVTESVEFTVLADTERLDRFLADQLSLSRTVAARLIADKAVTVGGRPARASRTLQRGEVVTVSYPADEPPRTLKPAAIPLTIVFEDDHLAVIDKPAGLVVHPAPGHWDDTLVNALVGRGTTLSGGAEGRPGIVHRLDKDTSGLMLVAKTDIAHRRLSSALAARKIRRTYAALTWGHLSEDPTVVDAPIARHQRDRKRMVVATAGRPARTRVEVVARFPVTELLRVELETGRTHQIRVHMAHIGHPVVGDRVYGAGGSKRISGTGRIRATAIERAAPRQALHSARLEFAHPVTGDAVDCTAEWPIDLWPALDASTAPPDRVAPQDPLRYLRFFNRDD
ncbi:MAG: RluA family pseudouridine synthase [Gemmatimonadetes bacterium]|nr:MAG: RluA family pseudouridine synthase [Gemmatimonadota bacterium]